MITASTDTALIDGLIAGAAQAFSAGNSGEAARLLAEAKNAAPDHPQVLSALGMYALKNGDSETGRRHLEGAVAAAPRDPRLWFNLSMACRAQGDGATEMLALDRVLALDARFALALLQKAKLLERLGKPKQAAQFFNYFLQCLPPPEQHTQALRVAVEHARTAVAADRAALESFLRERLAATQAAYATSPQRRFDYCLDILMGRRRVYVPEPKFMHFPRLPALDFHDRGDFPWLDAFEANTAAIRAELLQILSGNEAEVVPYINIPDGVPIDQWRELNRSPQWSAYYLIKNGVPLDTHLARCPKTAALLAAAPLADVPGEAPTAFFSLLKPRTRIPAHTGMTNTRLIVHVPLIVPPDCGFRVGSEIREWRPGSAWAFDDTLEHEAWNNGDAPRAVLIFDIWNPFLSTAERALVRAATVAFADFNRE